MAEETEWLDAEAAAHYLNIHTNTIYRMVRNGTLPALRFPVRIRREALDACLERCRIKPGDLAHLNPGRRAGPPGAVAFVTKAGSAVRPAGPPPRQG
jgi:excisionase family DNA binding protein